MNEGRSLSLITFRVDSSAHDLNGHDGRWGAGNSLLFVLMSEAVAFNVGAARPVGLYYSKLIYPSRDAVMAVNEGEGD